METGGDQERPRPPSPAAGGDYERSRPPGAPGLGDDTLATGAVAPRQSELDTDTAAVAAAELRQRRHERELARIRAMASLTSVNPTRCDTIGRGSNRPSRIMRRYRGISNAGWLSPYIAARMADGHRGVGQ